jgi:general secretion pathway protein G
MPERIRTGRRDEGFTLIELLIVIVILGILAAIVVFAVSSTRKDSVTSSCKTDVKSIQLAAEAYKTKNGNYPPHSATVGATEQDKLLDANGGLLNNWPDSDQYNLGLLHSRCHPCHLQHWG